MCNLSDGIELMAIERTIKKITVEVTEKVTKQVTKKVTEKVTKEVTENVTRKNNLLHVKNLMESGFTEIQAMDILKLTPNERMDLLQELN